MLFTDLKIKKKYNMSDNTVNANREPQETLQRFGIDFQTKCIASLIADKSFMERIVEILSKDYFELDAHKWIVNETINYFFTYKDLPTITVFKSKVEQITSDTLKHSLAEQLISVYHKIKDSDIQYIKEQFLDFCKNQKLKNAILQSVDYLEAGEYDRIKHVVDEAMKAGVERNLGHDYLVDVEQRMSAVSRECIKTNWPEIDKLLDGGIGKGELGFVVAPAGIGKCVGPNTEIEVQYMETGISIQGNSGKEYTLWIKPFDKYQLNGQWLYGWQIDNVFFEIEKMKQQHLQGQANIHKS